ncbi:YbjN domain-containing protein [Sphingobacterium siyangense]|uniref:YbjN domain-containing protein n=1 Tax=Sphingobacterium siyangense TaxID=459529 RepID=UPI003DA2B8C7
MLTSLKKFLEHQQWAYSKGIDENIILFGMSGENGNFQCVAAVNDKAKKFIFVSIIGVRVPKDKVAVLLEAINKINYHLTFGNFEMDTLDSGEIRFKTSLLYQGIDEIQEAHISNTIVPNLICADNYIPVFNELILENKTVDEVLKFLDQQSN